MDTTISFRISLEIKEKLHKIAEKDNRKLSALCRIILEQYIKDKENNDAC